MTCQQTQSRHRGGGGRSWCTFLVLGEAEEDVPARHQDHVVCEVLALDFCFLHDDNVCFQCVKHGLREVNQARAWTSHGKVCWGCVPPGRCGSPAMAGRQTDS